MQALVTGSEPFFEAATASWTAAPWAVGGMDASGSMDAGLPAPLRALPWRQLSGRSPRAPKRALRLGQLTADLAAVLERAGFELRPGREEGRRLR